MAYSGAQKKIIRQSVLRAFSSADFIVFLRDNDREYREFNNFMPLSEFENRLSDYIEKMDDEDSVDKFVTDLGIARPKNPDFKRLAIDLETVVASRDTSRHGIDGKIGLESLIEASPMLVIEDFQKSARCVCRIRYQLEKERFGTGFLVNDDLVLTNYHVIEAGRRLPGSKIICEFDYTSQGKGTPVKLAEADWLVSSSPYAASEAGRGSAAPTPAELDYALLRLERRFGGYDASLGERGFISIPSERKDPPGRRIYILQHPSAECQKMSGGKVDDFTDQSLRVSYDASTLPGSSGSPVFDDTFSLVALHHYGDPAGLPSQDRRNRGVPIWRVRVEIAGFLPKGIGGEFESPPLPPETPEVIWLGQPVTAAQTPTSTSVSDAIAELRSTSGLIFSEWPDNWRVDRRLNESETAKILAKKPTFVRAVEEQWASAYEEAEGLRMKLRFPFRMEPGQGSEESAKALLACPAVIWRPNGPDWTQEPPEYANTVARADSPSEFVSWLSGAMGLTRASSEDLICIEYPGQPSQSTRDALAIKDATEQFLLQAFGSNSNTQTILPTNSTDSVLKTILNLPRGGRQIVALSDYFRVHEPVTADATAKAFSQVNKQIEAALESRPDLNVEKIAVLVRSAEEMSRTLSFPTRTGLRDWFLLPITKNGDGSYNANDDHIAFIRQQLV